MGVAASDPPSVAVNVMFPPTGADAELVASAIVGVALPTTWLTGLLVDGSNAVLPAYEAVIECVPGVSADVVTVPTPAVSVTLPIAVAPSRNWIVPVGLPVAGACGETVAVNVTAAPEADGVRLVVAATCDSAWTTCVTTALVEVLYVGFPA